MKQIKLVLIALGMLVSSGYAQTAAPASKAATPWAEMTVFHKLMAATFHPSEEGNFKPLRQQAESLYKTAMAWQASAIPADYKPKETKETLDKLVKELSTINDKVKANATDKELQPLITEAHETFHKVAGECKKTEEPAH